MEPLEEMHEEHTDFAGRKRTFKTTLRETPGGLCAESVEQTDAPGGYRFRGIAPVGAPGVAYFELRKRMAHILNTRHIRRDEKGDAWSATHDVLRGRIDSDGKTGAPLMVIDGIALSWDEFGRTLLTHEGWDFEFRFVE
jgi:hypothetical protein